MVLATYLEKFKWAFACLRQLPRQHRFLRLTNIRRQNQNNYSDTEMRCLVFDYLAVTFDRNGH